MIGNIYFITHDGSVRGRNANIWGMLMVNVSIYGMHTDPISFATFKSEKKNMGSPQSGHAMPAMPQKILDPHGHTTVPTMRYMSTKKTSQEWRIDHDKPLGLFFWGGLARFSEPYKYTRVFWHMKIPDF